MSLAIPLIFVGASAMLGVSGVDDAFWPKLVSYARAHGADPRDWAAVFMAESGVSPKARNPFGAYGLNQFDADNLKTYANGMSPEDYLALPASVQLDAVARYMADKYRAHPGLEKGGARDLEWTNYLPATYDGPGAPDATVIAPRAPSGPTGPGAVTGNKVLVLPGETEFRFGVPVVRAGGLAHFLSQAQTATAGARARWAAVLAAIQAAEDLDPEPSSPPGVAPLANVRPSARTQGAGGLVLLFGVGLVFGTLALGKGRAT